MSSLNGQHVILSSSPDHAIHNTNESNGIYTPEDVVDIFGFSLEEESDSYENANVTAPVTTLPPIHGNSYDSETNIEYNSRSIRQQPGELQSICTALESCSTFSRTTATNTSPCNEDIAERTYKQRFKLSVARIFRRRRQMLIPFLCGILVGITMTALSFQQGILFSSPSSWSTDSAKVDNAKLIKSDLSYLVKDFKKLSLLDQVTVPNPVVHNEKVQVAVSARDFTTHTVERETRVKTRLYVGVITAEKFLGTRSQAVNNTWGSQVDKVEFFTQRGSKAKYGVPVVNLEKVSDSEYPPQKKMFTMLKYMCTHHLHNFEWFMRADDDVYVRVEMLKQYLTKIDSDRMVYMGQPGHGVPEVRDRLGLKGRNFCMGGPGVLFNRKALVALCPHVDQCMEEVVSGEEDVELGRCVTKHLHIECTHAWETLKLFYHSYQEEYKEEKPFLGNLAENEHVTKALTLHHLKVPYIMYRVHRHYSSLFLNTTVQGMGVLRKNIDLTNLRLPLVQQRHLTMGKTVPPPFKAQRSRDVIAWKSFGVDSLYCLSPSRVSDDITNDVLADLKQIGETGIDETIGLSETSKFSYSHVSDGYFRSDSLRGTDYLLDVYFNSKNPSVQDQIRRVHLLRPTGELESAGVRLATPGEKDFKFYVILPVAYARISEFESFMRNHYEPTFLAGADASRAHLIVIPFGVPDNPGKEISHVPTLVDIIQWYRSTYPTYEFKVLDDVVSDVHDPVQIAYASGVVHVSGRLKTIDRSKRTTAVALMISTDISLAPDLFKSCVFRTGTTTETNPRSGYSNYNFIHYKVRRKKPGEPPTPQLYQPVPFRVYSGVTAERSSKGLVAGKQGGDPGTRHIPNSMVSSEFGFWDIAPATGENGNAVLAPLCGRVVDLQNAANDSLALVNSSDPGATFRDLLFKQIYAGQLTVMRVPDLALVNIPRR